MAQKKSFKNAAAIAMACIIAIGGMITAAGASGQTHITYDVPQSAAFSLTVTAEGNGYVQQGEKKISNSTEALLLKVDEQMLFEIYPDGGETVEKILLNGKDITSQLQDKQLTVDGAQQDQTLTVSFSKMTSGGDSTSPTQEPTAPQETMKPGGGTSSPTTGDSSRIFTYIALGTVSLFGMLILISMKRENKVRGE